LFVESGAPLLLFWSSGREIAADHVRFGTDFRTSVRFASKYVAMLDAISVAPTSTLFTWPHPETDLVRFVTDVANAARQSVRAEELPQILGRLVPGYRGGARVPVGTVMNSRSDLSSIVAEKTPDSIPLIAGLPEILGRSDDGPRDRLITKSVPPDYFAIFGGSGAPATIPVELTGGARILINGPLLHFAPGNWTAIATFRVADNQPSNAFYFDVICGYDVFGGTLRLPVDGIFTSELPFVVPSAANPVEVRFRIVEGAISGSFELLNVSFKFGHDDGFTARRGSTQHRVDAEDFMERK
jgi:hypothetical protein